MDQVVSTQYLSSARECKTVPFPCFPISLLKTMEYANIACCSVRGTVMSTGMDGEIINVLLGLAEDPGNRDVVPCTLRHNGQWFLVLRAVNASKL